MTINEYTISLLKENGCALDCYKGEYGEKYALKDMREYAKENEVLFPVEDVAAELIRIGNEQPDPPRKGHKPYCMIFDLGDMCDGIEFDSLEEAKCNMEDTYINWEASECMEWSWENGRPAPTPEQIETWDRMIDECACWIVEWNEETGEYGDIDDASFMSEEDLESIGWKYWEELKF